MIDYSALCCEIKERCKAHVRCYLKENNCDLSGFDEHIDALVESLRKKIDDVSVPMMDDEELTYFCDCFMDDIIVEFASYDIGMVLYETLDIIVVVVRKFLDRFYDGELEDE
jgi:hypothetical protein